MRERTPAVARASRRVLGERARIAELSRIRVLVLGDQDGLLVPIGVVTGLAGAASSSTIVLAGGLAEEGLGDEDAHIVSEHIGRSRFSLVKDEGREGALPRRRRDRVGAR